MERRGDEIHVEETEVSAGSKEGVVRWVLILSTALAILLLGAVWIFGGLSQDDAESQANVSRDIRANEEDGRQTDSIVSDDMDTIEGATAPATNAPDPALAQPVEEPAE